MSTHDGSASGAPAPRSSIANRNRRPQPAAANPAFPVQQSMEQMQLNPGQGAQNYYQPPSGQQQTGYGGGGFSPAGAGPTGTAAASSGPGMMTQGGRVNGMGVGGGMGGAAAHGMGYGAPNVGTSMAKLDPRTLPNPSNVPFYKHKVNFNTGTFSNPPPAYSKYMVVDRGSCSPRFMRSTMTQIPTTAGLLNRTNIPFALVVQPLAEVGIEEQEVPVLESVVSTGPIRCRRCSAYISPHVKWVENGRCYVCPFCSTTNEIPDEYFSPIEANGYRRDIMERMELICGSVDWVAPTEFVTRPVTENPLILFVIDASSAAIQSGLLRAFVNAAKQIMETQFAEDSKVCFGFITFNKSIHFWRLVPKLQLVLVPHIDHVFSPLPASCFIANYASQRHLIDAFFDELLTTFPQQNTSTPADSCLGAAVNAAMLAIGNQRGGRIILLQSALPNHGPGALKNREDISSYGKDAERLLYQANSKHYATLAGECAKRFIQIDTISCATGYSDLATLGNLSRLTGGHISYIPQFSVEAHEEKLFYDLFRILTRPHGSEAIGKLRTSEGISVESYHGHFVSGDGDVEMAGIDADQTLVVYLKYDGNVEEKKNSCVQFAMVHTNEAGQRLIRVHTLAMHSTNVIANVFKSSDLSAVFIALLRKTLSSLGKNTPMELRTELTQRVSAIIASYRKHCTKTGGSDTQLILPEALKLLPIYTLGAIKTILLSNPTSAADVTSIADARIYFARLIASASLESLMPMFYPRIYSIHKLHRQLEVERLRAETREAGEEDSSEEDETRANDTPLPGDPDHYGSFWLPGLVRASASELEQGGAYLVDTGDAIILAFHPPIDTTITSRLLNETGLAFIEDDDLNQRVWNIISAIRFRRPSFQPVLLTDTSQNTAPRRLLFNKFVEDGSDDYKNRDQIKMLYKLGYYGYLCHVHVAVQDKI